MTEKDRHLPILKSLGLDKAGVIGSGMEACVYSYDEQRVLKIYNDGQASLAKLRKLKIFYETLDASMSDIRFPRIEEIMELEETLITIETLIEGRNMKTLLDSCTAEEARILMIKHLAALLDMRRVNARAAIPGIKRFSEDDMPVHQDWHRFLADFLDRKLFAVDVFFRKHVKLFDEKIRQLYQVLSRPYTRDYALVHGDFCPENLLLNEDLDVVGIIDFGLMTMRGDFLFDVATGWLFFDMYEQYPFDFRTHYYNLLINTLGEEIKPSLSLYVMLYSIYSVNFYAKDCSDGHAAWCVKNLNDENLWRELACPEENALEANGK